MPRASILATVLALSLPLFSVGADDRTVKAPKPQSSSELTAESKKSAVLSPSADRLKESLTGALKQIKSMEETAAKSGSDLEILSSGKIAMGMPKGLQVQTVAAIGRAQAKLGDLVSARSTWQSALDSAGEISSFNSQIERGALYIEIAKAQHEAGERSEALFTLRQALQMARSIKAESLYPFEVPPAMEFDNDPLAKKTEFFRRIAQVQSDAGEGPASQETFRLAIETADSLKSPLNKVQALLDIAQAISAEGARGVWAKALDFAFSQKEEYPRARAIERVIRTRLKALPADETVALIADHFKGDLQHFILWIAADEIAASDKPIHPKAVERLCQLAQNAEFDRPSKKIKVFERIAEAQARLGDYDGAYRTAGEPHPVN